MTNSAWVVDPQSAPEPPIAIANFIARLRQAEEDADERRGDSRAPVTTTVIVLPIDEHGHPCENPFKALTRDLTSRSISLMHTRAITRKRVLIRIVIPGREPRWLLAEVLRCRAMGAFYDIAAVFRGEVHQTSHTVGRQADLCDDPVG